MPTRPTRIPLTLTVLGFLLPCTPLPAQGLRFGGRFLDHGPEAVESLSVVRHTVVSPDGGHVYAASQNDNAVNVFSRDSVTGDPAFGSVVQDGVGGVDGLEAVHGIAISDDGRHVYTGAFLDSSIVVFSRDAGSGALSFVERERDGVDGVDGLLSVHDVAISPDGKHVYGASKGDDAVAVFARNATTGALSFVEEEPDDVEPADPGRGLNGCLGVAVSPDGRHVYAVSGETGSPIVDSDHAINLFERDAATGELTFMRAWFDGVGGVDGLFDCTTVAVSPGGDFVYTGCSPDDFDADWIGVFERDPDNGLLSFVEALDSPDIATPPLVSVGGDTGLAFSPGGGILYATSSLQGVIYSLARHPSTGRLTVMDVLRTGSFANPRLWWAQGIAVAPGGRDLYVGAGVAFTHVRSEPAIEDIRFLPNGNLRIEGLAEPGAAVQLQEDRDLDGENWNTLLIGSPGADGRAVFELSNSPLPLPAESFYRLRNP